MKHSNMGVPNEGYSKCASCTPEWKSTLS